MLTRTQKVLYRVKSGYFATQLKPASSGFVVSGAGDSLVLAYSAVIHWFGFFDVSASDLRYMMFPQFAPAVSAR